MTPTDTLGRVPNQPKTPMRSLRIADELWEAAKRAASERGETLTDAVRAGLERYVKAHERAKANGRMK